MHQINDPCYLCGERNEYCHSECKKYNEWKVKQQKQKEKIKKEREIDSIIRTHIIKTVEHNKRHRHK